MHERLIIASIVAGVVTVFVVDLSAFTEITLDGLHTELGVLTVQSVPASDALRYSEYGVGVCLSKYQHIVGTKVRRLPAADPQEDGRY